jgi:hypothetical protein
MVISAVLQLTDGNVGQPPLELSAEGVSVTKSSCLHLPSPQI